MNSQETIRKAVLNSRKNWLHYTVKQEREIYALLSGAADKIEKRLNQYAVEGKLPPGRLISLLGANTKPNPDSIRGIIRQLRPGLNGHIKKGMRQSVSFGMQTYIYSLQNMKLPKNAKLGIGSSFIGVDGKIRTYDVGRELWKASVWGRINSDAMDYLLRTQYGRIAFSRKVWDITWDAEKLIRNRINTGVLLGESVDKVARDIKPYLAEPNARFHRVRKDGKLVLSKPAKAYHPGRGVYRSAYRNARRLARTEYARAYHEGMVRYVKKKTWLKGFISRVGSDNPAPYDEYVDGKFFPKNNPPMIPYHPNCVLGKTIVQAGGNITGAISRWYEGQMITFSTATGQQLTCTPNHPIFSNGQFIAANKLNESNSVVCVNAANVPIVNRYNIQKPARIQNIVSALHKTSSMSSRPVKISTEDFHGDGIGSKVAIVSSNSFLRNSLHASICEQFSQLYFRFRDNARFIRLFLDCLGVPAFSFPGDFHPSANFIGSFSHSPSLFDRIITRAKEIGLSLPSDFGSSFNQSSSDGATINTKSLSKSLFGKSRFVQSDDFTDRQVESIPATSFGFLDRIVHIESFHFSGYVYNLETTQSYYFANGIATHNCMCYAEPVFTEVPNEELDFAPTQAEFVKTHKIVA